MGSIICCGENRVSFIIAAMTVALRTHNQTPLSVLFHTPLTIFGAIGSLSYKAYKGSGVSLLYMPLISLVANVTNIAVTLLSGIVSLVAGVAFLAMAATNISSASLWLQRSGAAVAASSIFIIGAPFAALTNTVAPWWIYQSLPHISQTISKLE